MTIHRTKDYGGLVDQCRGFLSEAQLRAHFELYAGYVKKLNEIEALLATTSRDGAGYSFGAYSELRRREPVAYNGTVLHELYFDNLGPPEAEVPAALRQAGDDGSGVLSHINWAVVQERFDRASASRQDLAGARGGSPWRHQ